MKIYTTIIKAISPITGELTTYSGQHVFGISIEDAQNYCENNGLGYCKVDGLLISEIPCKEDGSPDFENKIDYETKNLN